MDGDGESCYRGGEVVRKRRMRNEEGEREMPVMKEGINHKGERKEEEGDRDKDIFIIL